PGHRDDPVMPRYSSESRTRESAVAPAGRSAAMSEAVLDLASPAAQTLRRRAIVSCAVGNFFELFDFVLYGFLAVPISQAFFPAGNDALALINTFITFGVGFLFRPLGAVVIGAYGDRHGRRAALVITIGLMALATGCTGL